ncbi:MAG: ABC-F family ATP-binding cassette domain-containing protein [Ruminococcus sp.]|nr:ABC-F family ATP-binding cassette domain-containing protein [Ruminococcus sp.]
MILLSAQNISKTYMERKVLDNVSFFLNEGDKVGIIGINGTGKSTLLKILAGAEEPDSGEVVRTNGIRISYLPQIPEFDDHGSVISQVLAHLPNDLRQTKEFEARSILDKFGMSDCDRDISSLSGGEKRRAGIASALVQPSDVLLLDEPTNHIDNETARMFEELLTKYRGAIVMVTHDRYFLNKVCGKIAEIDRGAIYTCNGNYSDYLQQKAQREADAEAAERKNRALYRREFEWISRGARARGTKSKDRIERFEELKNREIPAAQEKLQLQSVSSRLGRKTIEIENLTKSIDGKPLITDFSYIISRDARIGIIGRNGAGKSTFLKMLTGSVQPDSGSIVTGDTVKIGYFSQECESMDPSLRVIEYIRETADRVQTPEGTVTASQMLERFLFTPELQWNRIEKLSGGERKRLYLLKILMTAPNILLLDEPTNDLDIATLTILEDYLQSFAGAVIAVSHDRYFLDKLANEIFEFRGGECLRYNGNYSDFEANVLSLRMKENAPAPKKKAVRREHSVSGHTRLKFSFKEQREFETIDDDIAALEQQISDTEKSIAANTSDYVKLQELSDLRDSLSEQLSQKMERWVYLNELAERIANGETV